MPFVLAFFSLQIGPQEEKRPALRFGLEVWDVLGYITAAWLW